MALPSTLKSRAVIAVTAALTCSIAAWLPGVASADDATLLAQAPGGAPAPKAPQPPAAASPKAAAAAELEPAPAARAEPAAAPAEAAPAPAAAPGPAAPEPAPEGEPSLDAAPEPELEPLQPTLSSKDATSASKQRLQQRLNELEAERASTTNLLPWITVATGATLVAVSASVGAAEAFDCDRETDCTATPLVSLVVVAGAAIATAGAIWLVRTDDDIRELEMQHNQLKLDLERLEHARWKRQGLARRVGSQVSFGFQF